MNARLHRLWAWWCRWVAWLHRPERPEALALLRISFGLALTINVTQQVVSGQAAEMYPEIAHGGVFGFRFNGTPYTLFRVIPLTVAGVYAVLLAQWLGAVMLTVGLFTRAAAVVCWATQVTLMDRMVMYRYDGDNVFRIACFLMVMAPGLASAWSLDARWRGKGARRVPAWVRRLFILQLAIIYTRTGVVKLASTWSVMEGWSALYLALNLPAISRWPGDWAAHPFIYPFTQLGTFVTSWWELLFFVLPLSMHVRRSPGSRRYRPAFGPWRWVRGWLVRWDLRWVFLGLGIIMHVSLLVVVSVGLFSVVMLSLYPAYLHPHEAAALGRRILPRGSRRP